MPHDAEPGPWELQRSHEQLRSDMREGFAGINARLDRLVSSEAFVAEQRRVDDRLNRITIDIEAERQARKDGDHDQQKALDKLVANQRWLVAAVILPIALFLGTIVITTRGTG